MKEKRECVVEITVTIEKLHPTTPQTPNTEHRKLKTYP